MNLENQKTQKNNHQYLQHHDLIPKRKLIQKENPDCQSSKRYTAHHVIKTTF